MAARTVARTSCRPYDLRRRCRVPAYDAVMSARIARVATPAAALALAAVVLLGLAPAAGAQAEERITDYAVSVRIQPDGTVLFAEDIAYDFGSAARHGITRDIPTRLRYDDRYDRLYPLRVDRVTIAAPGGRPRDVPWSTEDAGDGVTRIRIGDPNATVTGPQTYHLDYQIRGALDAFPDHDELYWNVLGLDTAAPVLRASARIEAPGTITAVACYAGYQGSTLSCDGATATGSSATFRQGRLPSNAGLTVVVGIAKGAIDPAPAPILEERRSLLTAFRLTPVTVGGGAALLLLLLVPVVTMMWRSGRDRRFRGSQIDTVMGGQMGDEAVPLGQADASAPVEFAPPGGIRPGQMGTLLDERANTLDVTATIVDLAVRGHLMIRELPKEGWFGKPDWQLIRLESDDGVLPYERVLLDGLFHDGGEVALSELRTTFVERLHGVQKELYADAVSRGWFRSSPDTARTLGRLAGLGILAIGALCTWVLSHVGAGLLGLPVVIVGLVLFAGASRLPARTAKGTAMTMRVRGFRTVIEKAEANEARWAEQENVFTRYLPYAIVFGCTEKWAKAFAQLGAAPPDTAMAWYVSSRPFAFAEFGNSIDGFAVATSGTMVATPSGSGGSGFGGGGSSGGGGGGGGVGSW